MYLIKDILVIGRAWERERRERRPGPKGIQTHNLLISRRALFRFATTAALHIVLKDEKLRRKFETF